MRGKKVGILGLAFKPRTDDIREAPALKIIEALLKEGASVQLYDPEAMPNALRVLPEERGRISYCRTAYEAAAGAHALLVLTEWNEFRELDLRRVCELMEVPILVDGRNLYQPSAARNAGFEYHSIGREGTIAQFPAVSTKSTRTKQVAALAKPEKANGRNRAIVN